MSRGIANPRLWMAALLWWMPVVSLPAASWWRAYKALDGMAEAACAGVTVTSRGDVVARHKRTNAITRLDGYSLEVLELPPRAGARVWEWQTGQLWVPAAGGVFLHSGTNWTWVRINQGSVTPTTPIRPVRTGKLLVLLPDQLLVVQVGRQGEVREETAQTAEALGLGRLLDLWVTRDGTLWVSAERGLARAEAPARSVGSETTWRRFEIPAGWTVREPRALVEDPLGHLVMMAIRGDGTSVALEFDGTRWWLGPELPEGCSRVWYGPGHRLWSMSQTRLWRFSPPDGLWIPEESCPAREFYDMSPAPDGTFWLATLDGLMKYSPPLWQPAEVDLGEAPVLAIAEDPAGRLWLLRPDRLDGWDGERAVTKPLPETLRPGEGGTARLWVTSDGFLWLQHGTRLWTGHLNHPDWQEVRGPLGQPVQVLGRRNDGTLVIQTQPVPQEHGEEPELLTGQPGQWKPLEPRRPLPPGADRWTAYLHARNGDEWLASSTAAIRVRMDREQSFRIGDITEPESVEFLAEGIDGRIYAAAREQVWCWDDREWTLVWNRSGPVLGLGCTRDGSLWVVSPEGLHRLTSQGWIGYGPDEGLPAAAVYDLWEDRRGRFWLATGRGLFGWHPEVDRDPPRTAFDLPERIEVPEGTVVTLGFRGQDRWKFTPVSRLLYLYRLDEGEWSAAQESTMVMWNDLPAGRHVLQVRAVDRNGNVEPRSAQREFFVRLPWYREPRLMGVVTVAGAGVLFFAALAWNRHRRLRRSYAEVERQVAERTRQLENAYQELLQSQKMRALGTLAAGVAHDFNNLLSIIKGSVQVIEDHMDDPAKVRRRLDRIKAMVEQGTRVVQAMLGFSRASAERFEPASLNQVVQDTLALLGERWNRDCHVEFEPAEDLPPVPVIRDLVQQILLNLLFNAAEAVPPGGRVVVRTSRRTSLPTGLVLRPAEAAEYVEVAVQDFGSGISPENLPRIFEPFFTTKGLSSRRGTGLGLTMVYEMAKRLEGGLAVESHPGKGSTFRLILPVRTVEGVPTGAGRPAVAETHAQS